MMVAMFLEQGHIVGRPLFPGQRIVSNVFVGKNAFDNPVLVIILICIPWMLLVKPYLEWKEHQRYVKERKLRGDVELQEVNPYQVFNEVNILLMTLSSFRKMESL